MLRGSTTVAPVDADYPFSETSIFDDPGYPKLHFVEQQLLRRSDELVDSESRRAEAMLRSAGFNILEPSGSRGLRLPPHERRLPDARAGRAVYPTP